MKRFLYFSKKALPIIVSAVLLLSLGTVLFYRSASSLPKERLIIFFYQTNVPSASASKWAQGLMDSSPEIKYAEAQCYTAMENAGYMDMQSGWTYITARLAKNEGDLLFLPQSQFDFMLEKGWLAPLERERFGAFEGALSNPDGEIMGLDITGMGLKGLEFPCAQKPDNALRPLEGEKLIACVYCHASDLTLAKNTLFEILDGAVFLGGENE